MKELTASWPGGAPFSNLMGLYGVLTLSRGEWGWRRSLTMVFIMLTRAMAVVPFSSFICLAYAPFRNSSRLCLAEDLSWYRMLVYLSDVTSAEWGRYTSCLFMKGP